VLSVDAGIQHGHSGPSAGQPLAPSDPARQSAARSRPGWPGPCRLATPSAGHYRAFAQPPGYPWRSTWSASVPRTAQRWTSSHPAPPCPRAATLAASPHPLVPRLAGPSSRRHNAPAAVRSPRARRRSPASNCHGTGPGAASITRSLRPPAVCTTTRSPAISVTTVCWPAGAARAAGALASQRWPAAGRGRPRCPCRDRGEPAGQGGPSPHRFSLRLRGGGCSAASPRCFPQAPPRFPIDKRRRDGHGRPAGAPVWGCLPSVLRWQLLGSAVEDPRQVELAEDDRFM
jgi:hypothetical protein